LHQACYCTELQHDQMLHASPRVTYPVPTKPVTRSTSSSLSPRFVQREEIKDIKDINQGTLLRNAMELPLRNAVPLELRRTQEVGQDKASSVVRTASVNGSEKGSNYERATVLSKSAPADKPGQHVVTNGESSPVRVRPAEMATYVTMLQESEERLRKSLEAQLNEVQIKNQKIIDNLSARIDRRLDGKQIETTISSFRSRIDVLEHRLQESVNRCLGMVQDVSERNEWTRQLVDNMQTIDKSVKQVDAEMQKLRAQQGASSNKHVTSAHEVSTSELISTSALISELEQSMNHRLEEVSTQCEMRFKMLCDKVNKIMQDGKLSTSPATSLCSGGSCPSFAWGGNSLTTGNVERLNSSYQDLPKNLDTLVGRTLSPGGLGGRVISERQVSNPKYTAETVTTFWPMSPREVTGSTQTGGPLGSSRASLPSRPASPATTRHSSATRRTSTPQRMQSAPVLARATSPPPRTYLLGSPGNPIQKRGLSPSHSTTATLIRSASTLSSTTMVAEGAS